jgi:hypothetical protein
MWYSIACSDAKSLPLFQQFARDHPACGDDVCPVSPVAATGRGSAVRTWHRHLPRDGTVLVEPVRSAVCSGDPEASDSSSFALELALAPGRSVRAEGLLSDGRPFYARLWSENGTSSLSLFFSADGLSGADADMRQLLEREGLVSFGDAPLDACSAAVIRDSSGNEFCNVGISVGEGDPDELLQLLTVAGSVRLVTPRTH